MGEISGPDMVLRKWLEAAERGDMAFVVDQLQRGMNVNAGHDRTNTTALMMAVKGCQIEMIRLLLAHGADLSRENSLGYTALTLAVIRSRSYGDYWHNPQPDRRPLELLLAAGGRYGLREAVLLNDVELARARLDGGADVDTGEGTYHGPLLKVAAELGYLEIVDLLLDRGADIEATDDLGQKALLSAARFGRSEVVRRLLDRGADIDAVDWSGQSALSNSAVEGHSDTFDLLLSRGARRGIVDALVLNDIALLEDLLNKELRCDSAVDWLSDGRVRLAMLAAGRGNMAIVRLLLDWGAAHFQERHDDHTLLAEAARHGHIDVAQLLVDRGADLHAVGRDGLTPLAWAVREGQDEVARILKLAGAVR
jgi:ankyrin repeat protein